MELRFKDRGTIEINDARIIFPNFSGAPTKFKREGGDRDFQLVIPNQEMADMLMAEGYNVTIKAPEDPDAEPYRKLKVKVNFNGYRPPSIYVESGRAKRKLTEETVGELDRMSIRSVDLDIRPYDWTNPAGQSGRTAYLESLYAVQDVDRFADRFAEEEYPEEMPFR